MKESTKRTLINWSVALGLLAIAFCLYFFLKGDYTSAGLSDATFFAGIVELLGFALFLIGRTGLFDMFSFTMLSFIDNLRARPSRRWGAAFDYREHKREERRIHPVVFVPYLVASLSSLTLAVAFLIVFESNLGW
jgi:hypothetical protein